MPQGISDVRPKNGLYLLPFYCAVRAESLNIILDLQLIEGVFFKEIGGLLSDVG